MVQAEDYCTFGNVWFGSLLSSLFMFYRGTVCVFYVLLCWSEAETESRQNFVSVKSDIPDVFCGVNCRPIRCKILQ